MERFWTSERASARTAQKTIRNDPLASCTNPAAGRDGWPTVGAVSAPRIALASSRLVCERAQPTGGGMQPDPVGRSVRS